MKRYLALWNTDADGLVQARPGAWPWGDWGEDIDMPVLVNAWYSLALEGLRRSAIELGHESDAVWAKTRMEALASGFEKRFWDGSKYRSPGYQGSTDDRANALAVVARLAPPQRYPALLQVLQTEVHASPYMEKYVIEALCRMGRPDLAQGRLKSRYARMVEDPEHSTLWEGWGIGAEGYGGGTTNHAWSGGPLTIMSQYFAGIEPVVPGFSEYAVFPQPGNLRQIEANVTSPLGDISEKFRKEDRSIALGLTSPKGTSATVGIPLAEGAEFSEVRVNGAVVWPANPNSPSVPGIQALGYQTRFGRRLCFKIAAGQWDFVAQLR
jgi:hypothetical protein